LASRQWTRSIDWWSEQGDSFITSSRCAEGDVGMRGMAGDVAAK